MALSANVPDARDLTQHVDRAARLLKAMANAHRLQVLCVLGSEELSVGEINDRVPLSQSALSQHLKVLREDGLVTNRRASQTVYYRVAPGPAIDVIAVLHRHYCSSPRGGQRKRSDS